MDEYRAVNVKIKDFINCDICKTMVLKHDMADVEEVKFYTDHFGHPAHHVRTLKLCRKCTIEYCEKNGIDASVLK